MQKIPWLLVTAACACLAVACTSDAAAPGRSNPRDASASETGPSAACIGKKGAAGETTVTVSEPDAPDGGLRQATVHVPAGYDAEKPTMLVLNLHGFTEPIGFHVLITGMSDASEQRGFIVVYPQGLKGGTNISWNAGSCCDDNTHDDVRFLRDLVHKLEDEYCIDPKRVFVTGLSNGGFMTYRLACEAADVFAAAAPVAAAVAVDSCKPSRPVPILAFHGTADTLVPFNGSAKVPPVSYSIDLWRGLDSCPNSPMPDASSRAPTVESTPEGGPDPAIFLGSTVAFQNGDTTCHTWSPCAEGSEVELCTTVAGGHSWPGEGQQQFLGRTTRDINATTAILDFFEKHPMP